MACPNCNSENRPEARFCKQCGRALQPEAPVPAAQPAAGPQVHVAGDASGQLGIGQTVVQVGDVSGGEVILGDKIIQQAAAAVATALHQLPPPPADFADRDAELAALCAAVETGGATISSLHGMGGVGKTALALKLAEQLSPRYPDAQIYLNLKGTDPQPLTPAQAMAYVVRAYHPTDRLPEDEDELIALYRSTLHGQRALLLMDNAAGAEQVEPLLPSSCLLLITSRRHFTLPGLRGVNLDALPDDDARALLRRIAPRLDDDCAGEIARLCGCLPLALRLAGSALAERADLDPARYLTRLRDTQMQLGLVNGSLNLSYDLLGRDLQRLWRLLAVFPADFETLAAAAVWEMAADPAQDALGELVRYSLVGWNPETARYRLHDLARLYADAQLEEEEREEARHRHAGHYEGVLRAADGLYKQGAESLLRGLALFDLEWPNIQEGQSWAAARAEEDEATARLCSAYPYAGVYCLNLRLHPRERVAWLEAALAAARRLKDRAAEGVHLANLGSAYYVLGQMEQAIDHYQQALAISRQTGDRMGEGLCMGNLGNAYYVLGQMEQAVGHYQQALVIARQISDRRAEGNVLSSLGLAYSALGQMEQAIEHHQHALATARQIGDRWEECLCMGNLGNAYYVLGQAERAVEHHTQALAIARQIDDRSGEGRYLSNLGAAHYTLGQTDQARATWTQAREALEPLVGQLGPAYALAGAMLGLAISDPAWTDPAAREALLAPALDACRDALAVSADQGVVQEFLREHVRPLQAAGAAGLEPAVALLERKAQED